jgi:hypothetical protein
MKATRPSSCPIRVELKDTTPEQASELLGGWGRVDGEHVWLDIATLKAKCPFPRSDDWDEQFARTMAYAEKNGWTDVTGAYVRAHIENGTEAPDETAG